MSWFRWEWWNGKKTLVGSVLLLASAFCTQVLVGIWEWNPWWMDKTVLTLDWVGMIVTGGGLAHKGVKYANGGGK